MSKPQTISSLVTSKTLFLIEHEVASVMCFDQPTNDFLDKIHITYHVDLLSPQKKCFMYVRYPVVKNNKTALAVPNTNNTTLNVHVYIHVTTEKT